FFAAACFCLSLLADLAESLRCTPGSPPLHELCSSSELLITCTLLLISAVIIPCFFCPSTGFPSSRWPPWCSFHEPSLPLPPTFMDAPLFS
uniref:Secreted protein n=1 Tax=Triticum urartu TaxID=4572 RepID=A0A8R7PMJ8_TRIUA